MRALMARLLARRKNEIEGNGAASGRKRKLNRDWRERAVKRAAEKYGKPFKCAGSGMAREVLVGQGEQVIVEVRSAQPAATVTRLPVAVGVRSAVGS